MHCLVCYCSLSSRGGSVAIQCGHVFHEHCLSPHIQQFLTCPLCLEPTSVEKIMKLDFYHISDDDKEVRMDLDLKKNEHLAIMRKEKLEVLKQKMMKLQACANDVNCIVNEILEKKLEPDVCATLKVQNFSCLEDDLNKLKTENNGLREEMEHLKIVKTVVTDSTTDAEDTLNRLLKGLPEGHESVLSRNLAFACILFKRDLVKHEYTSKHLRKEISIWKNNLKIFARRFNSMANRTLMYENELEKLKQIETTLLAQSDLRNNSITSISDNSAYDIRKADPTSSDVDVLETECSKQEPPSIYIKKTGPTRRNIEIVIVTKKEKSIEVSSASTLPVSGEVISAKKTRAYQDYFAHTNEHENQFFNACKKQHLPLVKVKVL